MKLFAGFTAAALAVVPSGCGSEHGAKNPDSGSGKLPAARAVAEPDAKLDLTTPQAQSSAISRRSRLAMPLRPSVRLSSMIPLAIALMPYRSEACQMHVRRGGLRNGLERRPPSR